MFVVIRALETALVSFGYRLVKMAACWLTFTVLGSGTKISIVTNSNESVAGNGLRWRLCFTFLLFLTKVSNLTTLLCTSTAKLG